MQITPEYLLHSSEESAGNDSQVGDLQLPLVSLRNGGYVDVGGHSHVWNPLISEDLVYFLIPCQHTVCHVIQLWHGRCIPELWRGHSCHREHTADSLTHFLFTSWSGKLVHTKSLCLTKALFSSRWSQCFPGCSVRSSAVSIPWKTDWRSLLSGSWLRKARYLRQQEVILLISPPSVASPYSCSGENVIP